MKVGSLTVTGFILYKEVSIMQTACPTKEEITKEYRGLVSAISHRMIQNPEMAKDAAQEAWMEILKSLKTFKGESKISTWIYTVGRFESDFKTGEERKGLFNSISE